MVDFKKSYVPLLQEVVLSKKDKRSIREQKEYMSKVSYASAIGSIIYVMICTKLDVAHALSITSRFQ